MSTKFLAAPAVLAAVALAATPASAVELPVVSPVPVQSPVAEASHYGTYIGAGWGWGWGSGRGHRHHRRHRGTSAGDVLGAVLVLGTIAAVANAATRAQRERSYPYPNRYPYPDRRSDYRGGPQGIDGAADLCLREVERDARAREVTRVERNASGWLVTGEMADGAGFTCSIGADGRIDRIDVGGSARTLGETDRQYDDERYRAARAAADAGPLPAYPGGPLPGDPVEDEADF